MQLEKRILKFRPQIILNLNKIRIIYFQKKKKPVFLNKYITINLGLYILNNEFREIGSIKIQNNYFNELNYLIKQETNNSIIISNKSNRELAAFQDLTINFKLNIKNINMVFYESKFELYILEDKKECDKCIIYAFINIIPLIIKFSIPNAKFSLNNDIVSINHYIKKLKILYCFPGNYSPRSLGIELKSKDHKELDVKTEFSQIFGELEGIALEFVGDNVISSSCNVEGDIETCTNSVKETEKILSNPEKREEPEIGLDIAFVNL